MENEDLFSKVENEDFLHALKNSKSHANRRVIYDVFLQIDEYMYDAIYILETLQEIKDDMSIFVDDVNMRNMFRKYKIAKPGSRYSSASVDVHFDEFLQFVSETISNSIAVLEQSN